MLIPSLNTIGFSDWSLTQMITFASKNHVPWVELRGLQNTVDLIDLPDFYAQIPLENARQLLRKSGVQILALNLSTHLDEDLSAHAEDLHHYARAAQYFSVPYLRFFSGGSTHERPNLDRIADGARQALEMLSPYPVQMIVETHDSLVHSEDILALNQRLGGGLNILWDIGHTINFGGERWQDTFRQIHHLVRYLHIKDTIWENGHPKNKLLFEGSLPVHEILSHLAARPEMYIVSWEWERMWDPTLGPGDEAARDFLKKIAGLRVVPKLD